MTGLGTIVNTAAIVAGGLVGMACGGRLTERYQKTIVSGVAVSVMFVGVAGTFQEMLRANIDGRLVSQGGLMLVLSLAIGSVLGEWWNLEAMLERFAARIRRVTHNERDGTFVTAFVTASLTFCVGWNLIHTDKHIRVANMLPSLVIAIIWAFAEKSLVG